VPAIRAAKTSNEYASALQSMLDVLQDPRTRVLRKGDVGSPVLAKTIRNRIWIHHGFPPEAGLNPGLFYTAFECCGDTDGRDGVTIPVSNDVEVYVRTSEDPSNDLLPHVKPDTYPSAHYPSAEYRILAVFKIWGVLHHFFAYRDLMDEDWDDVFASFLPRLIAAKNARDYNLTVSEMLTHTLDSNVSVSSDELNQYFGEASVGLRLRLIEKKPVITEILDSKATEAGLRVGDIVARVDEEAIAQRFNRIQDYISGGTPQRRGHDSLQRVLNGADASTAKLMVGTQDGPTKEIELPRTVEFARRPAADRTGDAIRLLANNIGYADLTRLPDDQIPAIFEKLESANGIIFDARGPVSLAARSIAEHLTSANDVAGAIITGPMTLAPDVPTTQSLTSTASYFFVEKVPPDATPKYKGKTVMLIDERTIGAGEHLGLWLEAANNTAFIGTPSAGADGATSNFVLPGGLLVTFSGQDVRHGNTGKLQRLGLQPTVLVAPTINGIRNGKDEVLQKAIEYLSGDAHTTRAALH
jgi:C-terminal processing protease CtpA/Prc